MQLGYARMVLWAFALTRSLMFRVQAWSFASAIAHMNVCLEIAGARLCLSPRLRCCCLALVGTATTKGYRHSLAIIYDEACRKEWSLRATRGATFTSSIFAHCSHHCSYLAPGDVGFDVDVASLALDARLIERARTTFDDVRSKSGGSRQMPRQAPQQPAPRRSNRCFCS